MCDEGSQCAHPAHPFFERVELSSPFSPAQQVLPLHFFVKCAATPQELRSDAKLVLEAVGQDAMALEFASPELRSQRDLVLAAVVGHGHALQFASDELKEDLI